METRTIQPQSAGNIEFDINEIEKAFNTLQRYAPNKRIAHEAVRLSNVFFAGIAINQGNDLELN